MVRRMLGALLAVVMVSTGIANGSTLAQANADRSPPEVRQTQGLPMPEVLDASHRVFMMTDSVGLGVRGVLQRTMPDDQVVIDGFPALMVDQLEDRMLRPRIEANSSDLGDTAIVAAGYNYRYWDPPRFDREIDSMIETLRSGGVKHIIWVTLREVKQELVSRSGWNQIQPYYWYFPRVNEHLRAAAERHPDLVLADWAAISDRPDITYDAIHLNTTGAQLYSDLLASTIRKARTWRQAQSISTVTVAGRNGVPPDAKAVAVNLTVTTPRSSGFLTAWACGAPRPATSNLNFGAEQTVAVSAIIAVGTSGQICVFNSASTHVIVDVQGYFGSGSEYQLISPTRLVDTRTSGLAVLHAAGDPLVVPVVGANGIAADAAAVSVNVTITDSAAPGFALVFPCDAPQTVPIALVNYISRAATPNFGIVKPGADGTVCIRTSTAATVIVDAFGYFPSGSAVSVVAPTRLADTRQTGATLVPLVDLVVPVVGDAVAGAPPSASSVVVTITAASPEGDGWVVAHPCGTSASTSTLNVVTGRATTNSAIVAPGAGGAICVMSNVSTHILVDISTWIFDGFAGQTPWRALDTREG